MTSVKQLKSIGEDLWKNKVEKVVSPVSSGCHHVSLKNAELFILTYGSMVAQLLRDYEDYTEVNKQLDKMYFHERN